LAGKIRRYLIDNIDANGNFGTMSKTTSLETDDAPESDESEDDEEGNRKMRLRRRDHINYDLVDSDDDEYFRRLGDKSDSSSSAKPKSVARGRMKKIKSEAQLGKEFAVKEASRWHKDTLMHLLRRWLFWCSSQSCEQLVPPECDYAAAQSMRASVPVFLASRPKHSRRDHWERTRSSQRQDDAS